MKGRKKNVRVGSGDQREGNSAQERGPRLVNKQDY